MIKIIFKILSCFSILFITATLVSAQNFTSSPYSAYGIGLIESNGFSENIGMGAAGIARPSEGLLNPLNPASYSQMGSTNFRVYLGMFGKFSSFESQNMTSNKFEANLMYLAIGFKPNEIWGASIGLKPFSTRGYNVISQHPVEGNSDYFTSYIQGSGSLSQFYFTNSFKLPLNISLGVNVSYLFGSLNQTETISYSVISDQGILIDSKNDLRNLYFDFGLQHRFEVGKHKFYSGITYNPYQELKNSEERTITQNGSTIDYSSSNNDPFSVPAIIGIGLGYEYNNKILLFADYSSQNWSVNNYHYKSANLKDSWKINIGGEFTPDKKSRHEYWKLVNYRLGFRYEDSYLVIRDVPLKESAVSCGLGLPLRKNNNTLNLSFEYGFQGSTQNRLIKEKYYRFTIGFSLHENWFVKPKYQ